ncbi:MAG: glycosyltransferase, partial [Gemmatimonadaceae bacterium]
MKAKHLVFFVTEDWYFVSHRLPLAIAAKDAGMSVSVITRVRDHGAQIEEAGLRLIPFEHSRGGINPLRESVTLLKLILLYRRMKPDIAHHVAMKPVLYGSIAAHLAGGKPHRINALAGMGWLFTSKGRLARVLRPAVRYALKRVLRSGVAVVQNPDDERVLIELGVPNAQIRRIAGSGVDLQLFRPQPEKPGVPVVVLPARLLWNKGVGEFVAAARMLVTQGVE